MNNQKKFSRREMVIKSALLFTSFASGAVAFNSIPSSCKAPHLQRSDFRRMLSLMVKKKCAVIQQVKGVAKFDSARLKKGDRVFCGTPIKVGANSKVVCTLPDKSEFVICGNSKVDLEFALSRKSLSNSLKDSMPPVISKDLTTSYLVKGNTVEINFKNKYLSLNAKTSCPV